VPFRLQYGAFHPAWEAASVAAIIRGLGRAVEMNKSAQREQKKTGEIHFQTSTPDQN